MDGYVSYRGYRTWYSVAGDLERAVPLLALHGGPGSSHNYFTPLEALADDRAVVLYDQLGCGNSDRPTDVEWSLDVFRDEVVAVREELGLEHIHLLGTSWGGMLALEHVLSGAGGIESLILSSTLASAEEWTREVARLRDELPPELRDDEDALNARHFYRGNDADFLKRWESARSREVYNAMWGPNEWTVTGALRGWDVRERLGEITMPTLVVRGRYDMCTDAVASTLLRGIPHAREVVLEESSHTPVLEETSRYLEVVRSFLRECDARVPTP